MVQLSLRTHPVELELARCLLAHSLLSDPGPPRGGAREAGGGSFHHGVPSARIAREGAPALSGEESSRLVGSRSAGTLWLGCVGLDALCSQPACTTTFSAGVYSLLKRKAEWLDGE